MFPIQLKYDWNRCITNFFDMSHSFDLRHFYQKNKKIKKCWILIIPSFS